MAAVRHLSQAKPDFFNRTPRVIPPPVLLNHTVLGSGGFGCTFEPEFACEEHDRQADISSRKRVGKRYVSKLFSRDTDALKEEQNYTLVHTLDPYGIFTVPMLGMCKADTTIEDIEQRIVPGRKTCGSVTDKLVAAFRKGSLTQAVYEFGGESLFNAILTVDARTLLLSLTPIITGIAGFQKTIDGITRTVFFHHDIKPANIVYHHGRSRLIDFGLSTNDPVDLFSNREIKKVYRYWPPEVDALYEVLTLVEKTPSCHSTAYEDVLQPFDDRRTGGEASGNYMESYEDFKTSLGTEPLHEDVHRHKFADTFASKADIFALGITVAEILLDSTSLEYLTPSEQLRVRKWVRGTTNFNAFKRYKPGMALRVWQAIWPAADLRRIKSLVDADLQKLGVVGVEEETPLRRSARIGGAAAGPGLPGGSCKGSKCADSDAWETFLPHILPRGFVTFRGGRKLTGAARRARKLRTGRSRSRKSPSRRRKSASRNRSLSLRVTK